MDRASQARYSHTDADKSTALAAAAAAAAVINQVCTECEHRRKNWSSRERGTLSSLKRSIVNILW